MKFLLPLVFLLISGCFDSEQWTGFVYPDRNNIPFAGEVQNFTIGKFPDLQSCRAGANETMRSMGVRGRLADYECGLNCREKEGFGGLLICEETSR
ncbi:hypothetical protein [Pusillimonas minor]|uniref:Lipoprotein n=1 Tax=Pusillimonas minor TaxID=2697024 RepID=A0A842HMT7_9BURK|nr:hypothetical protein [Pusillimonas minor]MBC2768581.1 hypothetical protein [Pusillimonas minor]